MNRKQRKKAANAVMVAIIVLVAAAGVYFVGRLRGWF